MDLLFSVPLIIIAYFVLRKIAVYFFPRKSLYFGNLAHGITDLDLKALCQSHGDVEVVNMRREWNGYAFVHFREAADAERARISLNHHYLHGKVINVSWAYKDRYGNIAHPLYRLAKEVFWYVIQIVKNIVFGSCAFIARSLTALFRKLRRHN